MYKPTTTVNELIKLNSFIQAGTESGQPQINVTFSADVLNSYIAFREQQAVEAYQQEQERTRKENDNGDLLTPKQAKAMFPNGLSDATLWRYNKSGLLHKKAVGGKIFYSRKEIEKLLQEA